MLLYDEIIDRMTLGGFNSEYSEDEDIVLSRFRIEDYIKSCIVFGINNVARYYFENFYTVPTVKELPNVAPPYPVMWFEYTIGGVEGFPLKEELRIAVLTRSTRISDYFIDSDGEVISVIGKDEENKMFITEAITVVRSKYQAMSPNTTSFVVCNSEGVPILTRTLTDKRIVEDAEVNWHLTVPAFLAMSFMHCKNVKQEVNYPPRVVSKHGTPRTKFYTLMISPMKKILEHEGQSNKTGLKMALHICRGHFKDYSKGSGLFGRNKGLYWWDSHVRGDSSHGVVVKDYSINTPST